MELINPKVENSGATADGRLAAAEFNNRNDELQNLVKRSGLLLSSGILDAAGAVFLNATKAHSFQDNGVVNAVQLRPISGPAGVKVPENYDDMEGVEVSFVPAFTSTSAVTIGFGQTANIGDKPATYLDGSPFVGGELQAGRTAQFTFNGPAQAWRLNPWSLPKGIVGVREFSASSTYVRPSGVRAVLAIGTGAGSGGGFAGALFGSGNATVAPGGHAGRTDLALIPFLPNGDEELIVTIGSGGVAGTFGMPAGLSGGVTRIAFSLTPTIFVLSATGGPASNGAINQSGVHILVSGNSVSPGFPFLGGPPGHGSIASLNTGASEVAVGGLGGTSFWGTSGSPARAIFSVAATNPADPGQGAGAGGGGGAAISIVSAAPAAGSDGFVLLLEIA